MLLHRKLKSRLLEATLVAAASLVLSACQASGGYTTTLTNSQLPSGLLNGGGATPTTNTGSTLPPLTGTGVPTSLPQATSTGTSPTNIALNQTANFNYAQLLQAWQQQWAQQQVPYSASVLPQAVQSYIIQAYCYFVAQYGLNKTPFYAYVLSLYLDVLGRLPEWSAIAGQYAVYNNMDAVNVRLAQATAMLQSGEYTATSIQRAYGAFLRRPVTAVELNTWKSNIASGRGATLESLYSIIVASNEYFASAYGGSSNVSSWIQAVYRDLLGRAPQAWEVQYYAQALVSAGSNREAITLQLVKSDESSLKFAVNAYLFYLNRYPTAAELSQRLAELRGGSNMKLIMANLLASAEYTGHQVPRYGALLRNSYCR